MIRFFVNLALFCVLIGICTAPPPDGNRGNGKDEKGGNGNGKGKGQGHYNHYKGNSRRINDEDLDKLQKNCKNRKGGCQGQSDRAKKTRNAVKESYTRPNGVGKGLDENVVERRFKKTLEAKKAIFELNGLPDVDPNDDGLFGGDMALTEEQSQRIINRTKGIIDPDDPLVPLIDIDAIPVISLTEGNRTKRANSLALDYYTGNRWPSTTINFYINPSGFTTTQANVIRAALKSMMSVSCLKFVEALKSPVIEFVKAPSTTDPGTCGWSSVGYQGGYNAVNLNFASYCVQNNVMQGTIVHETLHALGFGHEHNRYDRDRYLKINWNNVDPQSYDVFDQDDPQEYNPFCIPFDLLSIMHYDPYVGAIDGSKPAMIPLSNPTYYLPKMGRGIVMTATDARLLNKIYCEGSSTCKDKSVYCGWTACLDCATYGSTCPRSCGKCPVSG